MPERKTDGESGGEGRGRIDLSAAQVAASALATVVGALLASELGVYGTILGAAVVSVGATVGGAVFQHIFRRTGEQLRDAVDRGPARSVDELRRVPSGPPSGWNEPRVLRARRRWTWKSYVVVSALVFALGTVPILAFELATGQPVSATVKGESGSGTSLGGTVGPKRSGTPGDGPSATTVPTTAGAPGGASPSPRPERAESPGATPGAEKEKGEGGGTSSPSAPAPSPSATSASPTGSPTSVPPSAGASGTDGARDPGTAGAVPVPTAAPDGP
ncbi:hypothetical protein ACWEQL_05445 [Kitasatospora sp. NPDC004240]